MTINWKHVAGTALVVAAGVDSYLAGPVGSSAAAAMHISAAAIGLAGTVILLLQKSILEPTDPVTRAANDLVKS